MATVPPPSSVTPFHLIHALLPDDQDDQPLDARAHFEQAIQRLDGQLELAELWKARVAVPSVPEEPTTLQDLVQIARRRLRSDRLRVDSQELAARKWLLGFVIEELSLP